MPAPLNLDSKYVDALIEAILERKGVLLEGNESRRLDRNRQRSQAWEEVRVLLQPIVDKPLTVEAVKSTFKHRQMKIKRLIQGVKDGQDSDVWNKLPELNGLSEAETQLLRYLSNIQMAKEDTENEFVAEDDSRHFPMNSSAILRSLLALDDNESIKSRKRQISEDNDDDSEECIQKNIKLDIESPCSSTQDSQEIFDNSDLFKEKSFPFSNIHIPHLSQALEVSATPISYAASNTSESIDNQVPEAVIHAVVDRKSVLLEDNMSRKACRNKQRCEAWEEVRQVAEGVTTSGTVTLDMVKGIFKYRQMKIRRIYEEYQQKPFDIAKYSLTEAEQRLFDWYCDYQPPTHHRNSHSNQADATVTKEEGEVKEPESAEDFPIDSNLLNLISRSNDESLLQMQREVLQTQKEMFVEQMKMFQALVTTLNGFTNWMNNNNFNNNTSCKSCQKNR